MVVIAKGTRANSLPLWAALLSGFVSFGGNAISGIAIPWFVLETSGSAATAGFVAAFAALPPIFAAALGGVLIDRLGYKRAVILADGASAITVAAIPILHHAGLLGLPVLLVLVLLGAALDAPGYTARAALLPDLARMAHTSLDRANAAARSSEGLASLVGPLLAGILIAALGPTDALWVNAVTFMLGALLVGLAVPRATQVKPPESDKGYIAELIEGFQYIRSNALLRSMVVMFGAINFLGAAVMSVVLPVYARTYFDAAGLGLLLAGFGGGTLAGMLLFGQFSERVSRRITLLAGFAGVGLPFAALAFAPPLSVSVGLLALAALFFAPVGAIATAATQQHAPQGMLARVLGVQFALAAVAAPLGPLAAGVALQWVGIPGALLIASVACLAIPLFNVRNRALKQLDV